MTRLSRGETPVRKQVIDLGFRPDNVRMSLDGSVIYAAGHSGIQNPRRPLEELSNVATIDPDTLEVRADLPACRHRRVRRVDDGDSDR